MRNLIVDVILQYTIFCASLAVYTGGKRSVCSLCTHLVAICELRREFLTRYTVRVVHLIHPYKMTQI